MKDPPTENLLDYIDQFYKIGTRLFDLQGGEPTIRDDLGEIITHVTRKGAACSIATNGFKVEKHLESLKKCFHVCVSLDGTPDTTNHYRGKGTYETAIKALELLHKNKIHLRIHSVLTNRTKKEDIDHLVELAQKFNSNVNFVYSLESGNNKVDSTAETGFPDTVKSLVTYMLNIKKNGGPITSKDGAMNQVLNWPYDSQKILLDKEMSQEEYALMKKLKIPRCLWGKMACFFNSDGFLSLCPRGFDRDEYSVKIGERSIADAYYELAARKNCYMCGQMGDLSYSFSFGIDNLKTWKRF